MSGVEVAGLVLGAFPVLLEAIKAYRNAHEKIQTFKHSIRRLQLIDAQFRVCQLNFLNECRLLLNLIFSDDAVSKEMIQDPNHQLWRDDVLRVQFQDVLRDHVEACETIVTDTHSIIKEFETRLMKFQISPKSNVVFHRAQAAATFTMEKSRLEGDIANLRRRNADLNLLRTQLTAIKSQPKVSASSEQTPAIRRMSKVRDASSTLYHTLKQSWSCADTTHLRHSVKLCIESHPGIHPKGITLDMALTYEINKQSPSCSTPEPLIWLYVQADSVHLPGSSQQAAQSTLFEGLVKSLQSPPESNINSQHIFVPAITGAVNVAMRPIHRPNNLNPPATNLISTTSSPTAGSPGNLPSSSDQTDICKIPSICSYFEKHLCGPYSCPKSQCLGYLKTPTDIKYLFYPPNSPKSIGVSSTKEITSLISLIEQSQEGPFELLHRYQLALQISKSVLQFHGTAWLQPIWKLQDVSIFGSELSDQTLATLHLTTDFESRQAVGTHPGPSKPTSANSSNQPGLPSALDSCCASLCPGIYNQSLFSLGIALLEISYWQSLTSMGQNNANEFYTAHRLVRGRSPLGPKYRKIVERCLRCDFGTGTEDLEKEELQQAVWSKVLFPLEALIRDTSQEV